MNQGIQVGKMYAIKHKPTGFYLPEPKGKMGRGGSYLEPISPDVERPRLFSTERAAKNALIQWVRGKHKGIYEWEYDETFGRSYQITAGTEVIPVPDRIKEDMEVVPIFLCTQEISNGTTTEVQ